MNDPIRLAVIYGSVRPGRLCTAIAAWAEGRIWDEPGFVMDVIDPAALPLTDAAGSVDTDSVSALRSRIGRADAFLVLTPEYNHGYTAALKALIDAIHTEWQAKPVAFISYGGISGGLRAVEQLRLVFAELHAVTLRDTISFANAWRHFGAEGSNGPPDDAAPAMTALLRRLGWWASALRSARRAVPYARSAVA
ncbi:NADPH-dependent FMN reductase [Marinivivus vitaminiproducens]|uniref:NADPH-dependent FMN reductase n=1 Tax=Marinivivus vitaminiproducens TaxID=3035935 RepID=UPI00279B17DC|nr:NAD(P)H-dependent oxidoreductase [Geminicoccaceae bacterium SCSIO 64248]